MHAMVDTVHARQPVVDTLLLIEVEGTSVIFGQV